MKSPVAMEINEAQVPESSEEPEEGEIIDDFEVISDDSITFSPQKQGKSLEGNSPDLRALSLSSLTDLEVVVDGRQTFPHRSRAKVKRKRQQQDDGQVNHGSISPSRLPNLELEEMSPSLSDASLSPDRHIRKKRHLHHHKHVRKRRKVCFHRLSVDTGSESDGESVYSRSRLKKQLRAAISTDFQESHINSRLRQQLKAAISVDFLESNKNSLQNRLLAMTKKDTDNLKSPGETKIAVDTVDDSLLQEIENQNNNLSSEEQNNDHSSDEQNDNDMLDSELMELRLEALKTALKNKYKDKKQKLKIETQSSDIGTEINKENTNSNSTDNANLCSVDKTEKNEPGEAPESVPQSPEEDEDVLRALLLASMSNRITKKVSEVNQSINTTKKTATNTKNPKLISNKTMNQLALKLPTNIQPFKINNIKTKIKGNVALIMNNKKIDKRIQNLPKVKPLIINVNSDSDTEDDLFSTQNLVKCMTESNKIEITEKVSPVTENKVKPSANIISLTDKTVGKTEIDLDTVDHKNRKPLKKDIINTSKYVERADSEPTNETETKYSKIESISECQILHNNPENILTCISSGIESSVERFLREQRAKVDAEMEVEESEKIVTTRDVNSDELTVGTKSPVIGVAHAQGSKMNSANLNNIVITRNLANGAKTVDLTPVQRSNKAPNLAVRLLPKNKQIEYQKLLMKLRNAEKKIDNKRRVRRPSQRLSTSETINNFDSTTKSNRLNLGKVKLSKPKVFLSNTAEARINGTAKKVVPSPEISPGAGESSKVLEERKSDALLLHNTLKEMQQKVDGRSQIQKKYNCLKPLMKKINDASKKQKYWNQQVKKLLEELAEAKKNQEKVYLEMSDSVKQLVARKAEIDQNSTNSIPVTAENLFLQTTTPNYPKLQIYKATSNNVKHAENLLSKQTGAITKISTISNAITTNQNKLMSPKRISELADGKNSTTSDSDINIGDPNDIEMIISKEYKKKNVKKSLSFSKTRQDISRKAILQSKLIKYPNKTKVNEVNNEVKQQSVEKIVKNATKTSNYVETQVREIPKIPTNKSQAMKLHQHYSIQNQIEQVKDLTFPIRSTGTPKDVVRKMTNTTKTFHSSVELKNSPSDPPRSLGTTKHSTAQNKTEQHTTVKNETKKQKIMTLEEQAKRAVENQNKNQKKTTLEITKVTNELKEGKEVLNISTVGSKIEKRNIAVENEINKERKERNKTKQQRKTLDDVDKSEPVQIRVNGSGQCATSSKLKYVSPLDHVKRSDVVDPFAIMCPFEVDGTCKDHECSYKHFLPK